MVLEQLFPASWVERRGVYAFLIGLCYSVIGIGLAFLLFPQDPALVAVAFTSILLLPEINGLFKRQEHRVETMKAAAIPDAWHQIKPFVRSYMLILLGVFLVYTLAAVMLDGMTVSVLFREQLAIRGGISGSAVFSSPLFGAILLNNLIVVLACTGLAFLTGDGAIFILVWNASVWGTIFGFTASNAAILTQKNPFIYLILILIIVLPHAIIELVSYVLGAISGGIFSSQVLRLPHFKVKVRNSFRVTLIIAMTALVFLIAGALLESIVLEHSDLYRIIVQQSIL